MAESHSDPGAAAAQEEAEESPDVGAGSVLAARQVTKAITVLVESHKLQTGRASNMHSWKEDISASSKYSTFWQLQASVV